MKVQVEVPEKRIIDLFISACEGGSNYWCTEVKPLGNRKGKDSAYTSMLDGFEISDGENKNRKHRATPASIARGLELFVSEGRHFGDFMSENDDATTADVFLQLCVFGKVIYG